MSGDAFNTNNTNGTNDSANDANTANNADPTNPGTNDPNDPVIIGSGDPDFNPDAFASRGPQRSTSTPQLGGSEIFVDPLISAASCTDYNVSSRNCGSGTFKAFRSLNAAGSAVIPGDTVYVRASTWNEVFTPSVSGTSGHPIRFIAYPNETVLITGTSPGVSAIDISDRSYLVIDGFTVSQVYRWLLALRSHRNVIRNSTFQGANDAGGSAKTGIFFQEATYNRIEQNLIDDSRQDNIALIKSDYNLVIGNIVKKALHTLWAIKCGNNNVLRNNYFHNAIQKIGEIYDCDGVGFNHEWTVGDGTKKNLVELNDFAYVAPQYNHSPFSGIQYGAQQGIIRLNRFYDNVGPSMSMGAGAGEQKYCYENRIYNNVMFNSNFAGVTGCGTAYSTQIGGVCYDNIVKNNAMSKSVFVANDSRWPAFVNELAGKFIQIMTYDGPGTSFFGNLVYGSTGQNENYVVTIVGNSDTYGLQHPLSWHQTNSPTIFQNNIEQAPLFLDESTRDFHPQPGSPLIDHGVHLTQTASAGSGTSMRVADALYFSNGFGIEGLAGDMIQLAGQSSGARILAIDYNQKILTLDRSLTWSAGQGVSLTYSGTAPDIGAYESE